jgi:hypothetical protein
MGGPNINDKRSDSASPSGVIYLHKQGCAEMKKKAINNRDKRNCSKEQTRQMKVTKAFKRECGYHRPEGGCIGCIGVGRFAIQKLENTLRQGSFVVLGSRTQSPYINHNKFLR